MPTLTAIIKGEESLLIQCADLWLKAGHTIQAIISASPLITEWCSKQDVPLLHSHANWPETITHPPFDYFFSITNLDIIPDHVLTLPTKGAINFHDGPLPHYAGLYVTSWALLNQEQQHAVTWHYIEGGIDEGRILKQQAFPITADETAFTLNTKCYEAAIDSFAILVDELTHNTVQPITQDLSQMQYFAKHQRPFPTITLQQPSHQLIAHIRALDFGNYANPLTLPKLQIDDDILIVSQATPATGIAPPGTVLAVTKTTVTVAMQDGAVRLSGFKSLTGTPIIPTEQFKVGTIIVESGDREQAHADLEAVSRYESFWHKRLKTLTPLELPFGHSPPAHAPTTAIHHAPNTTIPQFLAFLARLTHTTHFDLLYSNPTLQNRTRLFASHVPLRVSLEPESTIATAVATIQKNLTRTQKRQTYPRDLRLRQPDLALLPRLPLLVEEVEAFHTHLPTGVTLALQVTATGESQLVYEMGTYTVEMIESFSQQLTVFQNTPNQDIPLNHTPILSQSALNTILKQWNDTKQAYDHTRILPDLFETQAAQTPHKIALVCGHSQLTYTQLDQHANQLAHLLQQQGVTDETAVGVYLDRNQHLIISLLAIHKAGGTYIPLDPTYPPERIATMIDDAHISVMITQKSRQHQLPPHKAHLICADDNWHQMPHTPPTRTTHARNLAYIIYTSGSTGHPKGVMVTHRNVINFLTAMDERIPTPKDLTWLAVTSLSFDISVLEIFWTLTRGHKLVLYTQSRELPAPPAAVADKRIDFSLFYFASDESEQGVTDKYKLLLEGAKFADANGFSAVWTPERHFHAFGGLYPNPSVASAAIAAITQNIRIRSGSCVLPLHSPVRVAEEWAMVDNISQGRVGLSFAAGWQPNDFVLQPQNYADRKNIMFRDIEIVKQLWRGERVTLPGPTGEVTVTTLPRPVQTELPIWVTAAGNPETFRMAGAGGFNILTHLLGQSTDDLNEKVAVYRQAWQEAGHPGQGHLTLMLHTYIGSDIDTVRETVRQPMIEYLRSALFLVKQAAWYFPTFKQKAQETGQTPADIFESEDLTEEEMAALLTFAFERYFETSGLFGTPTSCLNMVNKLKLIGVDEIACQIDFGVASEQVLAHLHDLHQLQTLSQPRPDMSIRAQIEKHNVTHMQCTPAMASMLLMDEGNQSALSQLNVWLVGGESLPQTLADKLITLADHVINMYGPTETTIWSATAAVQANTAVSIGTPIANTQLYILDAHLQPVPVGIPGDLYIGGDGVVRGYHNRPDLTAQRFITNPFNDNTSRLYHTGDRARWNPDGTVDFIGRADFQVKIRGYRIELGEIEAWLNQHPAVHESVVVAREEKANDKRLVAYWLPTPNETVTEQTLRQYIQTHLPDFMVPAHFILLDTFPKTPNNKIDRQALPAPQAVLAKRVVADYEAPQNDIQATIVTIWQALLEVPQLSIHDNFFELGGHSLLAVQANRMLKQQLGRNLSITDAFRFPTVHQLSQFLSQDNSAQTKQQRQDSANRAQARRAALQKKRRSRR